jgi:hypothetical protein
MKRNTIIISIAAVAIIAIAATILLITVNKKPTAVATAVVLDISEGVEGRHSLSLFAAPGDNSSSDLMSAGINAETKLLDAQGKTIAISDIQPGQLVELTYSGLIQESYPATYADVYQVKIMGRAEDELYTLAKERQAEWKNQFDAMLSDDSRAH